MKKDSQCLIGTESLNFSKPVIKRSARYPGLKTDLCANPQDLDKVVPQTTSTFPVWGHVAIVRVVVHNLGEVEQ